MTENKFSNCNFNLHIKWQNIIVWEKEHLRQRFFTLPARLRKILFQKRNNFPKRTTSILTQRSNIVPQVMPQELACIEGKLACENKLPSFCTEEVCRWHTGLSTPATIPVPLPCLQLWMKPITPFNSHWRQLPTIRVCHSLAWKSLKLITTSGGGVKQKWDFLDSCLFWESIKYRQFSGVWLRFPVRIPNLAVGKRWDE